MKSERLIEVLKDSGVTLLNEHQFCKLDASLGLVRNIDFTVDGDSVYSIIWFKNMLTLTTSCGLEVMADKVRHSGTWPNNYRTNLQFYNYGKTIAVIGIKKRGD